MIGIIDYGLGNINAFYEIYKENGIKLKIIDNYKDLKNNYNKIILPGVGSFDKAVTLLKSKLFFDEIINFSLNKNNKILGICVGMQILGSTSNEGKLSGFSFINNNFNKLNSKITPHIGWNNVLIKKDHYLFEGIDDNTMFYFLHSYCLSKTQRQYILAETNYEKNFISVFEKENITGIQFHPEKSHAQGQKILLNFFKN
tara:strand:- start:396 stop:995 length:600 start_codon:yes stop_codon:yes gene_type:complete